MVAMVTNMTMMTAVVWMILGRCRSGSRYQHHRKESQGDLLHKQ
jgi:hypothetical protein